jgi:hypothetical protein
MFTQSTVLVRSPSGTARAEKFSNASSHLSMVSGMAMTCNHEVARVVRSEAIDFSGAGFPVQAYPRAGPQPLLLNFVTVFV